MDNNAIYDIKHSKQTEEKKPLKAHGLDAFFEDFNPNYTVLVNSQIAETQNYFYGNDSVI